MLIPGGLSKRIRYMNQQYFGKLSVYGDYIGRERESMIDNGVY